MIQDIKTKIFWGTSLIFLALNAFFIANEFYWFMAFPLAVFIMFLYLFSLDKLILLIVLITPFTFKYGDDSMGFSVILPTEPIIAAIMLLFFLKFFYEQRYDNKILKHPVSIILILGLVWLFVTSVTSEIKLVSFKFFLSRLWYVVTFYFVLIQLFKEKKNIRLFFHLFGVSLAIIIIYITIVHSTYGFERKAGIDAVLPFFNDHTHYAAVIALIAPLFLVMSFYKGYSILRRRLLLILFLIFIMGIIFSYTRAGWVSLSVALMSFFVLVLKINYKMVVVGVALIAGVFFTVQEQLFMQLERNTTESSGDFSEHVKSITNISSDASNLERINRWRAAWRMFQEKPVLGWGPGTYQLLYAPYQLAQDRTIITTNFGDLGNAHSEYLGPLSEQGILGMLSFIAIAIASLVVGVNNFKNQKSGELKWISLGVTMGLITYFVHGFLNNFLDTDKASVLFWGFIAVIVAIQIYHPYQTQEKKQEKISDN